MKKALVAGFLMALLVIVGGPQIGAGAGPEDFYKGKTITFMVPFPPGGGFDVYAHAL